MAESTGYPTGTDRATVSIAEHNRRVALAAGACDQDAELLLEWARAGAAAGTVTHQQFLDAVRKWARDYDIAEPWDLLSCYGDAPEFGEEAAQ